MRNGSSPILRERHISAVSTPSKKPRSSTGNDPLVVSSTIASFQVKRILIDSCSEVEVLSWQAFKQFGLKDSTLRQASSIYGFSNHPIEVRGFMVLPLVLGDDEHTVMKMVEFSVVNNTTASNIIFGWPLMKMVKMVVATFCLKVKFPTST
ncbi:hypothetical protein ES288_D11G175400v1 [Gossypium darwinii]|uniref:Uncharacterized protein n=1 Tax=Gossypium darwinii TaxID=34276 RepID=A0A5D2AM81_GOSDA|nr:hypothetical protein ES288_D11G175400v1 [Gossypium darwinii]